MAHTALLIERLLQFSLQHSLIGELDAYVARNTLLDLFGLSEPWADGVPEEHLDVPTVLLDALLDDAAARGLYDGEVPALRVNFEARIMGAVMPRESETARPVRAAAANAGRARGHGLFLRPVHRIQLYPHRADRQKHQMGLSLQIRQAGDHHQPHKTGKGSQDHRSGAPAAGSQLSQMYAVHREHRLCGPREFSRAPESPCGAADALRRDLVSAVQPLCILQRALHRVRP